MHFFIIRKYVYILLPCLRDIMPRNFNLITILVTKNLESQAAYSNSRKLQF